MVKEEIISLVKQQLAPLFNDPRILGIVVFGSQMKEDAHQQSDIDICVISSDGDISALFHKILRYNQPPFDIKLFRLLPPYIQMEIIENSIPIFARDISRLREYFYLRRKTLEDELARCQLSEEEFQHIVEVLQEKFRKLRT